MERSDAQETRVSEQMERYIDDSPLSGAILEDRYFDGSRHWALLRFKEDCGQILMSSAIVRFQDELQIPDEEANEIIQNARLKEVLQISRRIDELDLEELSRQRAEILAAVLRDTGMTVTAVSWEGGRQTIGDPESETGKGRNRRVEIILRFE